MNWIRYLYKIREGVICKKGEGQWFWTGQRVGNEIHLVSPHKTVFIIKDEASLNRVLGLLSLSGIE